MPSRIIPERHLGSHVEPGDAERIEHVGFLDGALVEVTGMGVAEAGEGDVDSFKLLSSSDGAQPDEDVFWVYVAMGDFLVVQQREGSGSLFCDADDLVDGKGADFVLVLDGAELAVLHYEHGAEALLHVPEAVPL